MGNGIDWKIGVIDTIIGYETLTDGNNPNMSRSYGLTIEPITHTGILGTYRFKDTISLRRVLRTHMERPLTSELVESRRRPGRIGKPTPAHWR